MRLIINTKINNFLYWFPNFHAKMMLITKTRTNTFFLSIRYIAKDISKAKDITKNTKSMGLRKNLILRKKFNKNFNKKNHPVGKPIKKRVKNPKCSQVFIAEKLLE